MQMRRLAAIAAIVIATTLPARADEATESGAKAIADSLAAYLGRGALDQGVVTVKPNGDVYDIAFDLQRAIDAWKLDDRYHLQIGQFSLAVSPTPDGKWKVSQSQCPDMRFDAAFADGKKEVMAGHFDGCHFEGIYDPALYGFAGSHTKIDGISFGARTDDATIDIQMKALNGETEISAADGDAVTMRGHQTVDGIEETVKAVAPAKSGSSQTTTPFAIVYNFGKGTTDVAGDAVRAKGMAELWTYLVGEGNTATIVAHQDALKEKLRSLLPLWSNLEVSLVHDGFTATSPIGSLSARSIGESVAMSGIASEASTKVGLKFEGLNLRSPLLPVLAGSLVPASIDIETIDLGVVFSLSDLDRLAATAIDKLDLGAPKPWSDEAGAELTAIMSGSHPKITITPSRLKTELFDVGFSGDFDFSQPKPNGHMMIEAAGLDAALAKIDAAKATDEHSRQIAAALIFARGLATPGQDGKLVWALSFADGAIFVNGRKISG